MVSASQFVLFPCVCVCVCVCMCVCSNHLYVSVGYSTHALIHTYVYQCTSKSTQVIVTNHIPPFYGLDGCFTSVALEGTNVGTVLFNDVLNTFYVVL